MARRQPLEFLLSVAAAVALAAFPLAAADPQDNPPPAAVPFEPPLPPEPAPDAFLAPGLTPRPLLPRPSPLLRPRRPSGYIPPPCRKLDPQLSGALVDCWLLHHPRIADAIRWEFTPGPSPGAGTRWRLWSEAAREDLRRAFSAARAWRLAGFGAWPGEPFAEPPANQEEPYLGEDEVRTVLDSESQAWREFIAQVAVSLAVEIEAWVPWSLRDYDAAALEEILSGAGGRFAPSGRYLLDRDDGGELDSVHPGHLVVGGPTPGHPVSIFGFLRDQGILAPTPGATVGRLLGWSRDRMRHQFTVGLPVGREFLAFWQYRGFPPVSRMLAGTEAFDPELGVLFPGVRSWTPGCNLTARFLGAVLRVVNIPVREIVSSETCGHALVYFPGEGAYLTHADDPYSLLTVTGEYRGAELLVSATTWRRWFPTGDPETSCRNVGRQVVELNVSRPSGELVRRHCRDLLAGRAPAESEVLAACRGIYTVEELEARDLWERLDDLAASSPAEECVAWRGGG
jgi:hypothetical protein